jgi:predicted amidohydrolase
MTLIIVAAQSASVPDNLGQSIIRHLRFGIIAAEHGVRLLVFPELSLTGYKLARAQANAVVRQNSGRL